MRTTLLLFCFFGILSCTNQQKEANNATENAIPAALKPSAEKHPILKVDKPYVSLGRLVEGDSVFHTFNFKNTGNLPLKIISVNASCGCTTPKWSTDVIQPGKKGFIRVKFDSKGKEGKLQKTITAYCNTLPAENRMAFKVEVVPKK
ncbi:DUF1573 domain-containing protein [Aquirufa lenticrescens]|uniref:DUF1573 domain-containing protein n=1 Tax=Aquirufa lenticrescens TaxID=2696560 RepID=UPI001CAA6C01|nr:DUF1573 domain-containing protein [Aquirufa lenticrescens]UAJ14588.1 DUF1573 domain-containing protein [Aquirufa lenticrescens]